jgi:hypothetical protein
MDYGHAHLLKVMEDVLNQAISTSSEQVWCKEQAAFHHVGIGIFRGPDQAHKNEQVALHLVKLQQLMYEVQMTSMDLMKLLGEAYKEEKT